MDFYKVCHKTGSGDTVDVEPRFKSCGFSDVILFAKNIRYFWDEANQIWSNDESRLVSVINNDILQEYDKLVKDPKQNYRVVIPHLMESTSDKTWVEYLKFKSTAVENFHLMDPNLTWQNTETVKEDYVTKRLSYSLEPGDYSAFDELIGYLYSAEERRKLEWAIGSIVSGKSKEIQKFIVLFGAPGTGKGTILDIIKLLFKGYVAEFNAKELGMSTAQFATAPFKTNPLVAINGDGDLSRIEDNTKLNSIVAHETILVNDKNEKAFPMAPSAMLFIGSNKPVKITDMNSGLIRRLIDVRPTGKTLLPGRYRSLKRRIKLELGAIAWHCREVFEEMGEDAYNDYRPVDMIARTNIIYNYVMERYIQFKEDDGVPLKTAYEQYIAYCAESGLDKIAKYKFRDELKEYFKEFRDSYYIEGKQFRNYYLGFRTEKFVSNITPKKEEIKDEVENNEPEPLTKTKSLLDIRWKDCKAQYANEDGKPIQAWDNVKTTLKDLDTTKQHYILPPSQSEIVMDFDFKDTEGNKDPKRNLEESYKWPDTYKEFSRGGGVHSHYIYDGDPTKLKRVLSECVEVKVFTGNSPLRRKLSYCNDIPIAHLKEGSLPLKEEKVRTFDGFKNEKMLRSVIAKHLRKEIVGYTKPSIDLINDCLNEAYDSKMTYDVTDLRPAILAFANNSSHNAEYCIKVVNMMKFKSEEAGTPTGTFEDDRLMFFDVEVFPNLFIVCYKFEDDDDCHKMINPTPRDITWLTNYKLVGFNNRRYDNHILYARMLGKSNEELFTLSQRIISGSENALYSEAYGLSYTDVYDYSAAINKMSLKKWEIKLGIDHVENEWPWDQPVPEELWDQIADYCCNDVRATEVVHKYLKGDWAARECMAALTGMSVNTSTNRLSQAFIFEDDKKPQSQFIYTDLAETFPGYRYDPKGIPKEEYNPGTKIVSGKSIYMGMDPSEGGFVYAKKGIFYDVVLLDIASMHPSTIEALNLFGDKYTKRYLDVKQARIYIKHGEIDKVREMFDGKLVPYLNDESSLKALSLAFKTILNSVYGLTTASFENAFRDPRNVDNIVAKRGALFMIKLLHEVEARGYTVVHIKTDSIKIANSGTMNTYQVPDIVDFVKSFGLKYGYSFEHEATYAKMALVNDAVYIAKYDHEGLRAEKEEDKHRDQWTATGAQFQEPFVFKTLFTKEPLIFKDYGQTMSCTTAFYLDLNEGYPNVEAEEKELKRLQTKFKKSIAGSHEWMQFKQRIDELKNDISKGHNYKFVGRVGSFVPVVDGVGGGKLIRKKEDHYDAASGTIGTRWLPSEMVKQLNLEDKINIGYFTNMADKAIEAISEYGDFEAFRSNDPPIIKTLPWVVPCGNERIQSCRDCPKFDIKTATCEDKFINDMTII